MDLIRLERVTRRYGQVLALDCPEVRLPPGAIGLLGPNGAGKSTLLKILLGLLPPSSGRVEFLGCDPKRQGRTIRSRVGYLPENDAFAPGLTVLELVGLAGELGGLPRRQALQRAHEVLGYLHIEEERYRAVADQPTGVRQRVKLAQALVHDPEVLVLDEPTNGLDPIARRVMLELIGSLRRDFGKSVILSSHLLEDVDRLCDSLLILQAGRAVAYGRTEALRLDRRRRWRLALRGDHVPYSKLLADAGVKLVGEPRISPDGWEGLLEAPEGFSSRTFFTLLSSPAAAGANLRALVPEREKIGELFRRLTGGEAEGAAASVEPQGPAEASRAP